jgi:hypothetical protein
MSPALTVAAMVAAIKYFIIDIIFVILEMNWGFGVHFSATRISWTSWRRSFLGKPGG